MDSEGYHEFRMLMRQGFRDVRKHAERFIMLVELMQKDSKLPCFALGDLATAKVGSPVFTRIVDATSADVDVIFNGDKHVDYTYAGPIPGGGGTRPVVQSQQYAEKLGVVQLGIDPTTNRIFRGALNTS